MTRPRSRLKRALIALLLLALSCGTQAPPSVPTCVSPCGIELHEPLQGWTCADLNQIEAASVRALDPVVPGVCSGVAGWRLGIASTPSWPSPDHVTPSNPTGLIAGITYCPHRLFFVGNAPPFRGAFAHEVAHVMQGCWPLDHSDWADAGINEALTRVNQ